MTAHVQVVLADQSMSVRAGTALARALAVFPGTGVPHSFETHVFFLLYGTVLTKLLFETSFHHEIVFEMRYVAQECFDYKSWTNGKGFEWWILIGTFSVHVTQPLSKFK